MLEPDMIVVVDFPGVTGIKRRPAVVVSSALYHTHRPDVIVGMLTSQVISASGPTDYPLQDWKTAGLRQPTAFRSFLYTAPRSEIIARVGRLSEADWQGVQACLEKAFGPF